MAKKFSVTLILAFITGAGAVSLVILYFLGAFGSFKKTETFVLFFEESVNGLNIGSKVKYRGIPVGEVKEILIRTPNQDPAYSHIPVLANIEVGFWETIKSEANYNDLRGQLQMESLVTGQYYIELDYIEDAPPSPVIQTEPDYQEIYTIPSPIASIGSQANDIITRLANINFQRIGEHTEAILAEFERIDLVEVNQNLQRTLVALEETSKTFNHLFAPESTFRYRIESALEELEKTSGSVRLFIDYMERNPRALISGKPQESN